jgi:RNA polymerase sigma factor (sigma-70 family)
MLTDIQTHEIVLRNKGLIYTIANKHGPIDPNYDTDDLAQEMFVRALEAVQKAYDPERGTETGFLSFVSWKALYRIRKRETRGDTLTIADFEDYAPNISEYFRGLFDELCRALKEISDDLVQTVRMLYMTGGNVATAAAMFGLPKSVLYANMERIRALPAGVDIAGAF